MHVGLHSEIWQDVTNTAHTNKVEEALELHGIIYISTPRHGRRGGGAAITLIADSPLTITKLNHKIAFAKIISSSTPVSRVTSTRTVRPLPDSAIQKFANWVQHESWTFVYDGKVQSNLDIH